MRRFAFRDLSLIYKIALIPGLTLLSMGLMLGLEMQMNSYHTRVLRDLDQDVFEPLHQAETVKDEITALHTGLFALLALSNNQTNPAEQRKQAEKLMDRLEDDENLFSQFMDVVEPILPGDNARLRQLFNEYAARFRETVGFAIYDSSYGALVAGVTDEQFVPLHAALDSSVRALAERRTDLTNKAVSNSTRIETLLLALDLGATMLAVAGTILVSRGIAGPVLILTRQMNRLASGDTDFAISGVDRRDEVGLIARAVGVFRENIIARRQSEEVLRRTNMQFDAALNSMLQGMIVWGPDQKLQLVNNRLFALFGLPPDAIRPGMTVEEVIENSISHGMHEDQDPREVCAIVRDMLTRRRSAQTELMMRFGLHVRVASEPMANGGTVVTFEDTTEKHDSEEQIAFMAHHDALTGLPNRKLVQEHMAALVGRHLEDERFTVLCLDLDYFKEVNDTLGHAVGDELLRMVAGRLYQCVRTNDLIARLGGDEFAIVLDASDDAHSAATSLATRLVESVSAPYEVHGHNIVIGTSIGIALSEPDVSGSELLKRADVALYRAKEERGSFVFFEPGMEQHLQARRALEADLRLALPHNEFALHYQPLYSLAEDRVTGFEALLRWKHPIRGAVSPADFIPLAEQTGLIVPIGEWVLQTACAEAASWPNNTRVAVNLSAVQMKHKNILAQVRQVLKATGLSPWRLELEITETVLLQDTDSVMNTLTSLHDMGVRVSMDDFGTGYSSLSYLRQFPFDKIKIDRSFVSDLRGLSDNATEAAPTPATAAAQSAATIVRAIVGLGENLGISTIAEGVETLEQFKRIRAKGCTEVQGYFISPPLPASEISDLLHRLDTTLPGLIDHPPLAAPQQAA